MSSLPDSMRPLLAELSRREGVPTGATEHFEQAISSSPMLGRLLSSAMEAGHLRHIRLSEAGTHSGGHYDAGERAIYVNAGVFERFKDPAESEALRDNLTATLGHEASHAHGRLVHAHIAARLEYEIEDALRDAGPGGHADLSGPVERYLGRERLAEAEAERAGWNVLADRVARQSGNKLNFDNLLERAVPTTDCVEQDGGTYRLAPGLAFDARGMLPREQTEAVARCHFDPPNRRLGREGDSDYRHYYATYAIERIEAAVRDWRDPPEVRLDLTRLGLEPEQLQRNGLDFGDAGRTLAVTDPAVGRVALRHSGGDPSRPPPNLSVASSLGAQASTGFADPAHAGHALYEHVRQTLYDRLPPGTEISGDRLAQIALAAGRARVAPGEPLDLHLGETTLTLSGRHPGHWAQVDLSAAPPAARESAQQAADLAGAQRPAIPPPTAQHEAPAIQR